MICCCIPPTAPTASPSLSALIEGAGLVSLPRLIEPWRYEPANFISDGAVLKRWTASTAGSAAAIAEQMTGNLKTHIAYAVPKRGRRKPSPSSAIVP